MKILMQNFKMLTNLQNQNDENTSQETSTQENSEE